MKQACLAKAQKLMNIVMQVPSFLLKINLVRMKNSFLVFIILSVIATSCYYEDGPIFSLRTPKMRVVNKWKYDKVTKNGKDITSEYTGLWAEYKNDGTSEYLVTAGAKVYGNWSLSDDSRELSVDFTNQAGDSTWSVTYTITKLKEKEIWMNGTDGDYTYKYEMSKY